VCVGVGVCVCVFDVMPYAVLITFFSVNGGLLVVHAGLGFPRAGSLWVVFGWFDTVVEVWLFVFFVLFFGFKVYFGDVGRRGLEIFFPGTFDS
jgi:hypothetical protein